MWTNKKTSSATVVTPQQYQIQTANQNQAAHSNATPPTQTIDRVQILRSNPIQIQSHPPTQIQNVQPTQVFKHDQDYQSHNQAPPTQNNNQPMISQQKQIYWVPYTKSDQGVFERVHEIEMHVGRQPPQDLQPIRDQRSPTHQPPAYFIATTKDVSFAHAPAEHVSCRKYRLIEQNQFLENFDDPKISAHF